MFGFNGAGGGGGGGTNVVVVRDGGVELKTCSNLIVLFFSSYQLKIK